MALERVAPSGRVGLDLLAMDPVPGATVLQRDFHDAAAQAVLAALAGQADIVLSDMAAQTAGHQIPTTCESWR